jgi:hypothetical protein
MPLAPLAQRVHSSKLVLLSNTVTQVALHTVAMIAHLAKTAVGTRVLQNVRHTETVTTLVAQSVLLMVTVTHVLHMVVQVQLPVVATVVK